MPVGIQINYGYKPYVYYVEQQPVGGYPVSYNINLREDIPYIIESNIKTEKSGVTFKAETEKDLGFYFSASGKPQSIYGDNNKIEMWRIVLYILLGVAVCAFFVSTTILILSYVRNKKQRKRNK